MTAARQGGCKPPGDGAEPRGRRRGGTGRPGRGSPQSSTGPTRGLRDAQHRSEPGRAGRGHKEREGAAPAQGRGTRGKPRRPRPQRGSLPASPIPAPTHSTASPPLPRTEPSLPPPPDRSATVTVLHRPHVPTSFPAAAAAPSPPAPPPYTGGRAAPRGANRGPGSNS